MNSPMTPSYFGPPEMSNREPPANLEAEQALLGYLLMTNDGFHMIEGMVEPEHFADPAHQRIFEIARQMVIDQNSSASPTILARRLRDDFALEDLGGIAYIGELAANALSFIDPRSYAAEIADLYARRLLIATTEEAATEAYASGSERSARQQIEDLEQKLFTIAATGRRPGDGLRAFGAVSQAMLQQVSDAMQRGTGIIGVPTGLADLDRKIGGLSPTHLIILAARPAMGKTGLAVTIGLNAAKAGHRTAIFSLEMSAEELTQRMLASEASVDSDKARRGALSSAEFQRMLEHRDALAELPLWIEDAAGLTPAQIKAQARRLARTAGGLDLLIVDYLQLLEPPRDVARENQTNKIGAISRALKVIAKELRIPVLCLSQLSRDVERRDNKRPMLSDLRDSGSIEQDADIVMFLYREEYYLTQPSAKPAAEADGKAFLAWEAKLEAAKGKAELGIAKQRHGSTGWINLAFDAQFARFGNLAHQEELY